MRRRALNRLSALAAGGVLALAGAGCRPKGEGHMDIREPRFFSSHTGGTSDASHNPRRTSYFTRITVGDRYSRDPRPDGTFNLDLIIQWPGLVRSQTHGGPFRCSRVEGEHIRCLTEEGESGNQGPSRTTVEFVGERIASMTIVELRPPYEIRAGLEDTNPAALRAWPQTVATFRDSEFGLNDTRFVTGPSRADSSARSSDADSAPANRREARPGGGASSGAGSSGAAH
ncbi:MAG: hypothetical protein IT285_03190 [Bdellovibrionales bacterium]|nr:hypothetical protein [Bdellovibrionales bacterium]